MLVFGEFSRDNGFIHSYFVTDHSVKGGLTDHLTEVGNQSTEGGTYNSKPDLNSKFPRSITTTSARNRNASSPQEEIYKEDENYNARQAATQSGSAFVNSFYLHLGHSIKQLCADLEKSDKITSFNCLRDTFHRRGINMRLAWLVYTRLNRKSMKEYIGIDILVRSLKRILNSLVSKKLKHLKSQNVPTEENNYHQERKSEIMIDKNEFFTENFFKKHLAHYINLLLYGTSEVLNSITWF